MSGRPILGPTPSRRQQSFRIRLPDEIPPVEQHPRCQGSAAAGGLPPAHLWTPPAIAGAGGAHRWTAGPGPGPWTAQRRRGSAAYAAAQPDHRPSARRPPHASMRDRLHTGRTPPKTRTRFAGSGLCTSSVTHALPVPDTPTRPSKHNLRGRKAGLPAGRAHTDPRAAVRARPTSSAKTTISSPSNAESQPPGTPRTASNAARPAISPSGRGSADTVARGVRAR